MCFNEMTEEFPMKCPYCESTRVIIRGSAMSMSTVEIAFCCVCERDSFADYYNRDYPCLRQLEEAGRDFCSLMLIGRQAEVKSFHPYLEKYQFGEKEPAMKCPYCQSEKISLRESGMKRYDILGVAACHDCGRDSFAYYQDKSYPRLFKLEGVGRDLYNFLILGGQSKVESFKPFIEKYQIDKEDMNLEIKPY